MAILKVRRQESRHMGWRRNLPMEVDVRTSFARQAAPTVDWRDIARVTIDMLPDVALLEMFDFYMYGAWAEAWQMLVHVCRKWRSVVFGSPRRLNLRLSCTARKPVKEMLDVWPLLPIVVWDTGHRMRSVDNIIAALEQNHRVCRIELLRIPSSQLDKVLMAMRNPFPVLTRLQLGFENETSLVIPESFLGGSVPHLRSLVLDYVPFPRLPKLLSSATHLVHLHVLNIPHSGYISPEAMVTCLSVLTRLEILWLLFESPRSRPHQKSRRPPLPTRTLLPALTQFEFKGVSEYLEDLVARVNAPLLDNLKITFFHQLIFDTPHLAQFISRTPKLKAHDEAHVVFSDSDVWVTLPFSRRLELRISCRQSDWQLSSLAHVCSSSFPQALIPMVEHLYVQSGFSRRHWQDDMESDQWLEFLQSFSAVKDLYLDQEFAPLIAPALQQLVGERVIETLPDLQSLFLEGLQPSGPLQQSIGEFVAARQLANHPVAVSRWERK